MEGILYKDIEIKFITKSYYYEFQYLDVKKSQLSVELGLKEAKYIDNFLITELEEAVSLISGCFPTDDWDSEYLKSILLRINHKLK